MLNELNLEYKGIQIQIPLIYNLTFITGDSGSGKTFVVNAALEEVKLRGAPFYILDEAHFRYYESVPKKDALIIIDNVDLLFQLYPNAVDFFNSSQYQVLMFGRNLYGLRVYDFSYGFLEPCLQDDQKILRFRPMCEYLSRNTKAE